MPDRIKILGQVDDASTEQALYTVPDYATDSIAAQTTCSSVVVCNRAATSATFRISVSVYGTATANTDYLFYDSSLAGNSTMSAILGITLDEKDVMRVKSSSANLTFTLFGVETY